MWRLLTHVCLAVVSVCFVGTSAALAGDDAGMERFFYEKYEFRLGGFAHGVGSAEEGSADINAELVFHKLWGDPASQWNWLIPRPHIGVSVNTAGETDYAFAGALWTYDITRQIFVEGFVGGAVHDGTIEGDPSRSALGSRVLFHLGGSVGYRITNAWSVLFTFEHLSNGNAVLHAAPSNQGLNEYGLRVGYAF